MLRGRPHQGEAARTECGASAIAAQERARGGLIFQLPRPPISPSIGVSASETPDPMRIQAAVLRQPGLPPPYAESRPLEITELDLAPPGRGEVQVKMAAAGLCHSDLSVIDGSRPRPTPMALGHEAAGIVEAESSRRSVTG
jgi:hypothetical protein